MAGYVDIDKELADAPIGPLHKQLGVLVTLITLFDGYDTFNPAYVIHYVMKPWGLAPSQAGLLISSGLLGFLIGAAAQGVIADRLGRRGALVASLWVVNIFTLATAFYGDGFYAFCILRILTGIGLGALLPLATTFINELAPPRISNAFSLWGVTLGWSLGGVLAGLVGLLQAADPVRYGSATSVVAVIEYGDYACEDCKATASVKYATPSGSISHM